MRIFIVYAHPSEDSFTREVRDSLNGGNRAYWGVYARVVEAYVGVQEAPAKIPGVSAKTEGVPAKAAGASAKAEGVPAKVTEVSIKAEGVPAKVTGAPARVQEAPAKIAGVS